MVVTDEQRKEAHIFYKEALHLIKESGTEFMLGGGFALNHYTGLYRDTKDLDIFCRADDYNKILKYFADKDYKTELTDPRWLAKVFKGEYFIDVIFDTPNLICTVDDSWFEHAVKGEFAETPLLFVPAEELIWCKIYVQNRERYDGADVNHILLKYGAKLDWKRLWWRTNKDWQLLMAQLLSFQYVYPSDYANIIPQWLWDKLLNRANRQYELPASKTRICRGPIIDQSQYAVDVLEWGYKVYTMKSI